ncbi:MAG: hypothetical protein M1835_002754 [Candelina submexicana]|nr:MAG: hypothetical protein M1835_002754 [Candelina submexicana]
MPRKPPRHTKGQKPRVNKTSRREYNIVEQSRCVAFIQDGCTYRTAEVKTGIPASTIQRIYKRALSRCKELGVSLNDPKVYQNGIGRGRPHMFTEEEADRICERATSTLEERKKTAVEHIQEFGLDISESKFKTILYKRGWWRDGGTWKTSQQTPKKKEQRRKTTDHENGNEGRATERSSTHSLQLHNAPPDEYDGMAPCGARSSMDVSMANEGKVTGVATSQEELGAIREYNGMHQMSW